MRTIRIAILFVLMLASCGEESLDDVTLVFPTGKYVNWTNFELIHMAFKLHNDSLIIDGNYDFETKDFVTRGVEESNYFPAITKFLKMKLTEYESLSLTIDTTSCARLTPIYIESKSVRGTKLIPFKTVAECNANRDSVPEIVMELRTLRKKYAR